MARHMVRDETSPRGIGRFVRLSGLLLAIVLIGCGATPADPTPRSSASIPAASEGTRAPDATGPLPSGPTTVPSPAGPIDGPTKPPPTLLPADDPDAAALQATLDTLRQQMRLPSISAAVRFDDGRTWSGVSGDAVVDPERLATTETVYGVASITKTFVAALILKLAEDGKLQLDEPIRRFLPQIPRAGRITIRMLLNHTSGIHNYFESAEYNRRVFAKRGHRWTVDEILGLVHGSYFPPGTGHHYSNTGFVLLGLIAEQAGGAPIEEQLRARFFDPLGLDHTVFQGPEPTPTDVAHAYLRRGDGFVDHTGRFSIIPHPSAATVAWAAGAIASTPTDLARWADALYGGDVLAPESLAQMTTYNDRDHYGLGMRVNQFRGRLAFGHTGGIRGFTSGMWYFPDAGVTIVALMNRGMIPAHPPIRNLLATLIDQYGGPAFPRAD